MGSGGGGGTPRSSPGVCVLFRPHPRWGGLSGVGGGGVTGLVEGRGVSGLGYGGGGGGGGDDGVWGVAGLERGVQSDRKPVGGVWGRRSHDRRSAPSRRRRRRGRVTRPRGPAPLLPAGVGPGGRPPGSHGGPDALRGPLRPCGAGRGRGSALCEAGPSALLVGAGGRDSILAALYTAPLLTPWGGRVGGSDTMDFTRTNLIYLSWVNSKHSCRVTKGLSSWV